jgi:exonuclease III
MPATKTFKIGTFNCRGFKSAQKEMQMADDMRKYGVDIMAIQEMHLTTNELHDVSTTDGRDRYTVYTSGKKDGGGAGVGIMTRNNLPVYFTPISDRICMCETTVDRFNRKITIVCAYAPTLPTSEKRPKQREQFYQQLESVLNTVSRRSLLAVAGDFNAQTGSGYNMYRTNMGCYGKGRLNTNGEALLQFANRNNLVITNTLFPHPLKHVTTWEAPYRAYTHWDGTTRKHPVRNQIDYILVRVPHRRVIKDSRSYSGTFTNSDHRLVRATLAISNFGRKPKRGRKIAYERLKDPITRARYAVATEMSLMDREDSRTDAASVQQMWDDIVEANKGAAEDIIGYRDPKKNYDPKIVQLSREQKDLGTAINGHQNPETRDRLRKERNRKLNELHKRLKESEHQLVLNLADEVEKSRDDSSRMYKAIEVFRLGKKQPQLQVDTDSGVTTDATIQIDIITNHFKEMFTKSNLKKLQDISPVPIEPPFSREEVETAVRALKNNRSAGGDELKAEQLKYGPTIVYENITEILNTISTTGEHPKEVTEGILIPLPKPGKPKGPVKNLRPIILLSMIRKILAVCMMRRVGEKINRVIPASQSAYRYGRGTTEQVMALKLMVEKAMTSSDFEVQILMMDMSRAFDTVDRAILMEDLRSILEPGELHIIKVMINEVRLIVEVAGRKGEAFTTNVGTPQGDCLSPTLFTLYLAKALSTMHSSALKDHNYQRVEDPVTKPGLPTELMDHGYAQYFDSGVVINLQYADDITWVGGNCPHAMTRLKNTIPGILAERYLTINTTKTEEYTAGRDKMSWQDCRYLGSMLHTQSDMKRRRGLANAAYCQIRAILEERKIALPIRINVFNTLVGSIYLYNSETWSLTAADEKEIDICQRHFLRRILQIRYPQTISNEKLYRMTEQCPWTDTIRVRRLRWYGHMMRMDEETPVRMAMDVYMTHKTRRPRGAKRTTWLDRVHKDLKALGVTEEEGPEIAKDRSRWRRLVCGGIGQERNVS